MIRGVWAWILVVLLTKPKVSVASCWTDSP